MPDSRMQLDSSAPIDFGTPFASHQLQRQDFTFAAEQSPAPSLFAMPGQTPHSRAGAGGSVSGQRSLPMHEDDLERFEEEDAEGWTKKESSPLLKMLVDHATKEENVYRHRWKKGDLVCWDNRSVMHRGPPPDQFPAGVVRDLVRTTVIPTGEHRPQASKL